MYLKKYRIERLPTTPVERNNFLTLLDEEFAIPRLTKKVNTIDPIKISRKGTLKAA